METKIDWIELDGTINFGSESFNLTDVQKAVKKGNNFLLLKDGRRGLLPMQWLTEHSELFGLAEQSDTSLHISKFHTSLLKDFIKAEKRDSDTKAWITSINNFSDFSSTDIPDIPQTLDAVLRPYQKNGYHWLYSLKKNRVNGILADDMGLGKTIQTITLLSKIYLDNPDAPPSLIIAPTSLIFNWENECRKFNKKLTLYTYTGPDRSLDCIHTDKKTKQINIIFTTYQTMHRDIECLKDFTWYYVILDESQQIKNPSSITHRASKCLVSKHRLNLTGTPVENSLMDLWSQMSFLNPGMLNNKEYFKKHFKNPIEKNTEPGTAEKLQSIISPFILRRTKESVADDLPPKEEHIMYIDMFEKQRTLYTQTKNYYRSLLLQKIDSEGIDKNRMKILEGLLRLRQICCHPQLLPEKTINESGKFEIVIAKTIEAVEENHKVLIFSQFTSMLQLLKNRLLQYNIKLCFLDGSTKDRQGVVKSFQTNNLNKVFLISLKAGGVGLNLTAADYVFHYDPWWNPAIEQQATDRTHRIGQKRKIFSYKLITKNSVEEKILELQNRKKHLVKQIISDDKNFTKLLTRDMVYNLFT
jgi:non-specific serine/threonine protein kinase